MRVDFTVQEKSSHLEKFLDRMKAKKYNDILEPLAQQGVQALKNATPVRSGKTANSWDYEIHTSKGSIEICWTNTNINKGVPIAVILQYGHGTRSGHYVEGIDYINPALRPIFDEIADKAWNEVTQE